MEYIVAVMDPEDVVASVSCSVAGSGVDGGVNGLGGHRGGCKLQRRWK